MSTALFTVEVRKEYKRVGDLKRWIDALTAIQMAQRGRLVLSDEENMREKLRVSGD